MNDNRKLYGMPDADYVYFDIATVWETDIEPEAWGTKPGRAVVHEYETRDPVEHFPDPDVVIDHIYEWACDNGEVGEHWGDFFPLADDEIRDAVKALYRVIADRIPYRMAGDKVGEHIIEWTGAESENPLLDGEPMYGKSVSA